MNRIIVFAALTNPFTDIGIISTVIECNHYHCIGPHLSVLEMTSPSGTTFIFDATTGALLGHDRGRLINDYKLMFHDGITKAEAEGKLMANRNKLLDAKKVARQVERWEFFRLLHAV